MEAALIAAIASITSAVIALFGVLISSRKASEARRANEELSLRLKQLEAQQQASLANVQTDLERMTYIVNSNHSKRLEVLTDAYAMVADVKITLEQYVVPMFADSETKNVETLIEASRKFEKLYKYCSQKSVFFSEKSNIMSALEELMSHINHIRNLAEDRQSTVKPEQAMVVIKGVNPVLSAIQKEVRIDLKLNF
ncbi:hypothetical protein [Vibrio paracholerae]|uniref:hypothetical protein n=1 Tax=Vibrio paracholerae TaxID=650003 RepID=UPI0020944D8F|nr:hypothetical protein [Vibrio paracholerae]MCO7012791.1 hypothetical protein [Vibrio paracholerae]MCO7033947.1 hypothetical protein [Vibrio paracholerae]MCO7047143.1 hypothetical protein [Vibrio paracholerae]